MEDLNDIRHLLTKFLNNSSSPDEMEKVKHIIKNGKYLSVWEEVIQSDAESPGKTDFSYINIRHRISDNLRNHIQNENQNIGYKIKNRNSYLKYAAIILMVVVSSVALYLNKDYLSKPVQSNQFLTKTTLPGQKSIIDLADGSRIYLNSSSTITYPKVFDYKRKFYLEGEAFFEVKPDKTRPFIVIANDLKTTVLGTSFNIDARPNINKVAITVKTGKVAVSRIDSVVDDNNSLAVLSQFQKLTYFENDFIIESLDKVDKVTGWINNHFIFEKTPLKDIISVLEYNYGVNIHMENEIIGNCKLTATFRDESLYYVLNAIKQAADIKFKINGTNVILNGKGCI